MLIISSVISFFILLPTELLSFSKSVLAALFSLSNFYFLSHTGYFDTNALNTPLLHTWSLGVEEQFYLIFPLLFIATIFYIPKKKFLVFSFLMLISFGINLLWGNSNQNAAFYLPYTRIWELIAGVLLSLKTYDLSKSPLTRNCFAFAGFGLIIFALFNPFNFSINILTVFPVIGTAALILAHTSSGTVISKILSLKFLVFTGLISYSLYLYHWPIIVFSNLFPFASQHTAKKILIFLLSFIFAYLSWKYIEQTFRDHSLLNRRKFIQIMTKCFIIIICFQIYSINSHGITNRFSREAHNTFKAKMGPDKKVNNGECTVYDKTNSNNFNKEECLKMDPFKKNYLLMGDSHAKQFYEALRVTYPHINILEAVAYSSIFDFSKSIETTTPSGQLKSYIRDEFLKNNQIDGIIFSQYWSQDTNLDGLKGTLEWAHKNHIPVIVLGPYPNYNFSFNRLTAFTLAYNKPSIIEKKLIKGSEKIEGLVSKTVLAASSTYISIYKEICPQDKCMENTPSGHPINYSNNHLSEDATLFIINQISEKKIFNP